MREKSVHEASRMAMQFQSVDEAASDKQVALRHLLDAWDDALSEGIEPETLANAALFAALTDLVATYGEDAVAQMTDGLSRRIRHAEFTLRRSTQ
jgi:hypothetical protein